MGKLGIEVEKGLYLGIDFGTTNSVVSIYSYDQDEVDTLPIDGSPIFPTVIQFEEDEENPGKLKPVFGIQAKEAAIIYPESTVMSVKRLLDSDEVIPIHMGEKHFDFTTVHIVSEILAHLKSHADTYIREELGIGGKFTGCVITVPANSTDKQKKRTKDAAVMAGFLEDQVFLRLEPAAAAIAYAVKAQSDKKVLIYDFGGGTFDACILQIQMGEENHPNISILSTHGDNHLGGNDLDKMMMDMIYEEFRNKTKEQIDLFDFAADDGVSVKQKKMAIVRLYNVARTAKERLSSTQSTKVVLAPFLQEPTIVNIHMEISKEAFVNHQRRHKMDDELFDKFSGKNVVDLVGVTIRCVDQCLTMANLKKEDIDEVFLVGGTSSVPEVTKQITKYFGKPPFGSKISPALSISIGAAYYCNQIMLPSQKGPTMVEKTIHPLGLEIAGRRFLEIVGRNIEIPPEGLEVEADTLLETNFDHITSMVISVYEDTALEPFERLKFVYEEGMKRLGGTTLRGIPAAPKGEEKVKVLFKVGQDNMLSVEARSINESGAISKLSVDNMYE